MQQFKNLLCCITSRVKGIGTQHCDKAYFDFIKEMQKVIVWLVKVMLSICQRLAGNWIMLSIVYLVIGFAQTDISSLAAVWWWYHLFNHLGFKGLFLLFPILAYSQLCLVLLYDFYILIPTFVFSVVVWLQWHAGVCWPKPFLFSFVTIVHPLLSLIVADLMFLCLWLTGVKSGLASAIVTVVVKETKSPVPLPWGNRTASCGQRCCRTSGRIQSFPTMSCRSGTR